MLIVGPLINFWGLERDLVIRDSEICVFEMFGVFAFRPDGIDILVIEVF